MRRQLRNVVLALALACSEPTKSDSGARPSGWLSLGLRDRAVAVLAVMDSQLYAGTDHGVFRASVGSDQPQWTAIGLASRSIKTLLILSPDTLLVSTTLTGGAGDTVALFRTTDAGQSWQPYQNGFGGQTEAKAVFALARLVGAASEILAAGGSAVVAKSDATGSSWRVVWGGWQLGAVGTHFVVVDSLHPGSVWAGGESGYFQPFLLHSEDLGETWREIWLKTGDNAHYSLAVHPTDPRVVFTGMEGRVMKSADGGQTWEPVLQPEDYPYFFGLGMTRATPVRVYAGGAKQGLAADLRELRLYSSDDAGASWQSTAGDSVRGGVRSLLVWSPATGAERVLVATGEGVWQFTPAR